MKNDQELPAPRMHPVNQLRWRSGSSGRPLTPRRGGALGLFERSARPVDGDAPSTTDLTISDSARRGAQARLRRVSRRGTWTARRTDRLAARATALRASAEESRTRPVRGPSGAAESREERASRHRRIDTEIVASLDRGETRHRRVGRGHRIAARLLPWLDALLFAYFVAGVSNANLARPWTTPVASLVAVAFTTFLVLTVAVFTPWLGASLRVHKSGDGQVRFADIGPVATGLLGLWVALVLAIGATMFVRVRSEAEYAGADPWAGTAVAILLALASVAMTGYVLAVAIADGTPEADELRERARGLLRDDAHCRGRERRAQRCDRRRVRAVRAALRREACGLVRTGDGLAGVDRTVDLVRLRTGAPADRPRPARQHVDDLDQRELGAVRRDLTAAPFE